MLAIVYVGDVTFSAWTPNSEQRLFANVVLPEPISPHSKTIALGNRFFAINLANKSVFLREFKLII